MAGPVPGGLTAHGGIKCKDQPTTRALRLGWRRPGQFIKEGFDLASFIRRRNLPLGDIILSPVDRLIGLFGCLEGHAFSIVRAMTGSVQVIHDIRALRAQVQTWRTAGERIALVPTMGALHEGHLSLMQLAQNHADRLVVSIFVNPTQFGPGEDFDQYPRTLDADLAGLENVGTDAAFTPTAAEMYPDGFATEVRVTGLTDVLCGTARPGHFDGVALIVTKLLLACLPDMAVFGEKDYQQLQVVRRFVTDLNIPVEIVGGPILREADGLALSSRNRYLSAEERQIAAAFPRILQSVRDAVGQGAAINPTCEAAKADLLKAGFNRVDYLEIRDTATLALVETLNVPARVFGAARIGQTRLIDNWAVESD